MKEDNQYATPEEIAQRFAERDPQLNTRKTARKWEELGRRVKRGERPQGKVNPFPRLCSPIFTYSFNQTEPVK